MTRVEKKSANHADCSNNVWIQYMQKYGYLPASVKVCSNVVAGANMQGVKPAIGLCIFTGCRSLWLRVIICPCYCVIDCSLKKYFPKGNSVNDDRGFKGIRLLTCI